MMTGPDFVEHLYQLAIWRHELATFAGVSLRTVHRWCNTGAPTYAVRLANAAAGVIQVGTFNEWRAWRVLSGPTGEMYSIEDMRAAHWIKQMPKAEKRDPCIPTGAAIHISTARAARP